MKIDLTKNRKEIINQIEGFISGELFKNEPFLKDNSSVMLSGSVATNTFDRDSDVDLQVIRSENIDKGVLNNLKNFKKELLESGSNIELRFARTYEIIEEYLNWNDDFILGELQNSKILHDPNNKLTSLLEKFVWYPEDIFEDKLKWLLAEMFLITEKELDASIKRNHIFYIEVLRTKYLRFTLTLIRLINKKYPVYDKKLYETTVPLMQDMDLINKIEKLMTTQDYNTMIDLMKTVSKNMHKMVQKKINIPQMSNEELLKFSTKNKIMFE